MKITDNPTIQLIKSRIHMLEKEAITTDQKAHVNQLKKEFSEMSVISDSFNSTFKSRGWIAYDRMDIKPMREALEIYKSKGLSQANDYLIDYYDQEVVSKGINMLWDTELFRKRLHLIKLAYYDFLSGRYHACIPVLLMMIDGVIADSGNNLVFFSAKPEDITAWDSIAGHESGLLTLKSICNEPRGKTLKTKITLPYRNGIMHGRDLGYANREVAAKCWALLFAIRDMLADKRDEKINREKYEADKVKTVKDIQGEIGALHSKLSEVIEMNSFKRLTPIIGESIPVTGAAIDYPENSPEKTLVEFIEFWVQENYGIMADYIFLTSGITKSKMAGRLKQIFSKKQPHFFSLVEIQDLSSCMCDLTATISISHKESNPTNYNIIFRLLYCEINSSELVVNPSKEGRWKVAENFADIDQIGTILEYFDE